MIEKDGDNTNGPEEGQNTTVVKILGVEHRIHSSEDPSYTARLAEFVDRKMREVGEKSPILDHSKLAVLAAMDFADELLSMRRRRYSMIGRTNTVTEKLAREVKRESIDDRSISQATTEKR